MSNKFKYVLFPDQTYIVEFEDFEGNPFKVEIPGTDIINRIRRQYALDKIVKDLDIEITLDMSKDWE